VTTHIFLGRKALGGNKSMPEKADLFVSLDQLGRVGHELGRGGQATVSALPEFTLPDLPGELVFKKYHVSPASAADLGKIVHLRGRLPPVERTRLDAIASWPCRVVLAPGGTVIGVVMPRIPRSYVDTLTLPYGGRTESLREVLNLFVPVERIRRVGRPVPTDRERFTVCRDLAAGLRFLHERLDVVFGDINGRNELWRVGASPTVMFLDCDAVRPRGSVAATKQLNAPDWEPPERTQLNGTTDLYKLGLFILRVLTPGDQASTRVDPAAARGLLDDAGFDLLTRAVGPVPRARPTAAEWTVHLSRMLGDPVTPPALDDAALDRRLVPAGHPVEVRWRATDAAWLDIVLPGRVERVDGRAGSGVVTVAPDRTGPVVVRAGNDYGVAERALGPVTVVPMPGQRPFDVPMPRLGWNDVGVLVPPRLPVPSMVAPAFPADGPGRPPLDWPRLSAARFPMDLVGLVTATPELDIDLPFGFER
jgi:hypothetical protein